MFRNRTSRGRSGIPAAESHPGPQAPHSRTASTARSVLSQPGDSTRARIRSLVNIATNHDSSMSAEDLFVLLGRDEFSSPDELEDFIIRDPDLRKELIVRRGEVILRGFESLVVQRQDELARTAWRSEVARSFSTSLVRACPWVRLIALSGSMAYRRAKPEDDIDFFLVTRPNSVWITLLFAMVGARIDRLRHKRRTVLCFNRILDEAECREAFRSVQDRLVGREALSLTILEGQQYYRSLLESSSWMGKMYPRLYAKALAPASLENDESNRRSRARPFRSVWNAASFFLLAPYLRLVGLWRNRYLETIGNPNARFRTVIRRGFFAYESDRYELLREEYRESFVEN